jgi:gamma-glutamylcyclotransferase (GGCT)/AIG2-like uncharacterized protein YtfP
VLADNSNNSNNTIPVFVYGSLKTGFGNNRLLRLHEASFLGNARTEYSHFRMFSLGSYPGVCTENAHQTDNVLGAIMGELWMVSSECLRRLDMLESNGLLYQREIIPTIATGQEGKEQRVHAWIYLWLKNPGLGSIEASFGKRVCYNNGCFFWT